MDEEEYKKQVKKEMENRQHDAFRSKLDVYISKFNIYFNKEHAIYCKKTRNYTYFCTPSLSCEYTEKCLKYSAFAKIIEQEKIIKEHEKEIMEHLTAIEQQREGYKTFLMVHNQLRSDVEFGYEKRRAVEKELEALQIEHNKLKNEVDQLKKERVKWQVAEEWEPDITSTQEKPVFCNMS